MGVRLPPDTEIIKYTSSIVGPKIPGTTNRGRKKTISLEPSNPLLAFPGLSPAKRQRFEMEYAAMAAAANVAQSQQQQHQQQHHQSHQQQSQQQMTSTSTAGGGTSSVTVAQAAAAAAAALGHLGAPSITNQSISSSGLGISSGIRLCINIFHTYILSS